MDIDDAFLKRDARAAGGHVERVGDADDAGFEREWAAIAAVRGLDADVVLVARSLGADRRRAFARVLAPLLTPVAASILAYLFVRALIAVSAVVLLAGPRVPLASLKAIDVALAGRTGEACALAVALSVMVLVVVGLRRTLPGREHAAVWFL